MHELMDDNDDDIEKLEIRYKFCKFCFKRVREEEYLYHLCECKERKRYFEEHIARKSTK